MIIDKELPIGVFDSGFGGVSVLALASKMLPKERFIYYGDSAHAPYGTKSVTEVKELSLQVAHYLIDKGIKSLVVACNTATSVAIKELREKLSIPIIGMEPALKPAVQIGKLGKIVVMATPITLREDKFQRLLCKYQDQGDIYPLPCPGLVELIERGKITGKPIEDYLITLFSMLNKEEVATIVLGCTHYIFIKKEIEKLMGDVIIVDGNCGTVKQLKRVLEDNNLLSEQPINKNQVSYFTSADSEKFLPLCEQFFALAQKEIYV